MILISACLLGIDCKYNGKNNLKEDLLKNLSEEILIPICPEQLGGLSTPREASEIKIIDCKFRVINKKGKDVTKEYLKGAGEALKIAELYNVKEAILKEKSPSCGSEKIYDGSFNGNLIKGKGITAQIFEKNNIKVYNEINYIEKLK